MIIHYVGVAASHTCAAVFPFASEYKTRDATRENVPRCISDEVGIPPEYLDLEVVELHTPGVCEDIIERAEMLARDLVTGCDGLDTGYTLHDMVMVSPPVDHVARALSDVARSAHVRVDIARVLFDAWQSQEQQHDDETAAREFRAWFKNKKQFAVGR